MEPVTLSPAAIESAESVLPDELAQRMFCYLATHPNASTEQVTAICFIENLSDVARKSNKYLATQNLFISCQRPPDGESSGRYQWGIYRMAKSRI